MPVALALVLSSVVVGVVEGQAVHTPRLRPTPEMFEGAIARVSVVRTSTTGSSWRNQMSPITKGMLIGGGIGLGATALFSVLYIQSTESSNYSGIGIPIVLGTALGAIVGAAIGAGFER
jgi:hypothetical protein